MTVPFLVVCVNLSYLPRSLGFWHQHNVEVFSAILEFSRGEVSVW